MTQDDAITVEPLDAEAARAAIPALAEILADAVESGASVGFMHWNGPSDYVAFWTGVAADVAAGRTILFAARQGTDVLGTAQLQLIGKPNQPHRAEIAKVLVHSSARRRGLGAALMQAAEAAARQAKRDLLVLDTDEHGAARRLYGKLGWTELGTVPRYALMPDGRDCGSTFFYKDLR
ncbi:GNAT family N-acetyltransferase [Bosea sp. (in: a-proteobacteria)]|uniref:GNAT family N-acetyltransferase n=1 Tax=Bosea sp. (in: a-proteobacteria) TaxID=1871050 RepID=UPI002B49CF48|nr:GNAT family N-acetyltransferase [Bosea sp. (in: a-proteobacteria)]WRH57148.1 MAG: GNAT family N-acetyltransferase [Bosea sp. (in: a-proteobacteria)]